MAYTLKIDGEAIPLTRHADLLTNGGNTIVYERDPRLRQHVHKIFSTGNTVGTVVPEMN